MTEPMNYCAGTCRRCGEDINVNDRASHVCLWKARPRFLSQDESAKARRELGPLPDPSLPTCPRCEIAKAALEKIADPRKRDHQEPDKYTEVGCLMNMASEALAGMERA